MLTLSEILKTRGLEVTNDTDVILVERGCQIPESGIIILYDGKKLDGLLNFIDTFTLSDKQTSGTGDLIAVKKDEKFHLLQPESIFYFQADGNSIYCRNLTEQFEVTKKLYELEIMLLKKGFIRINKSTIVNIMLVSEVIPWFGGRLLLKLSGRRDELEVSRNFVREFKEFLGI